MNQPTCEEYQFDGFRFDGVTSMLCLGGKDGNPDPSFHWKLDHTSFGDMSLLRGISPMALARAIQVAFMSILDLMLILIASS